jgi:hypothetical protein
MQPLRTFPSSGLERYRSKVYAILDNDALNLHNDNRLS